MAARPGARRRRRARPCSTGGAGRRPPRCSRPRASSTPRDRGARRRARWPRAPTTCARSAAARPRLAARRRAGDRVETSRPAPRTSSWPTTSGPADVAELGDRRRRDRARRRAAPTAHAAIVARSLGIPMVVGLGAGAARRRATASDRGRRRRRRDGGARAGARGASAAAAHEAPAATRERAAGARPTATCPPVTRDGRRVRVLVNAATPAELDAGLAAGAEGVGLLRTELAFLDATGWPTEAEHRARAGARARAASPAAPATVRVLDFGGDKIAAVPGGDAPRGHRAAARAPGRARGAAARDRSTAARRCRAARSCCRWSSGRRGRAARARCSRASGARRSASAR